MPVVIPITGSQSSTIKRMVNELLLTIKEKFSDVLISADHIKTEDQLGKGKETFRKYMKLWFGYTVASYTALHVSHYIGITSVCML